MSLITEALRTAQQLKIRKEKTSAQNGISDEILLGSEIVVDKAAKKMFLSQHGLIIVGFLSLFMVIAVLYNSSLFRRSSILKEKLPLQESAPPTAISTKKVEIPSEEITTLDTSHESIGSKPEKILAERLARPIGHQEKDADSLPPRKTPPTWQAKNRLALARDTSARRAMGSGERDAAHTVSRSTSPRTSRWQEEDSYRIASTPLQVESDNNISEQNHNNLGVTYYLRGDLEQALEQFKAAIQLNPKNMESHVNLGIVYKKQDKFQHALKAYEKAISLKPTSPEPYYNLAILYDDARDFKMAARAYYRFLQLIQRKYHPQKQKVQERLDVIKTYIK